MIGIFTSTFIRAEISASESESGTSLIFGPGGGQNVQISGLPASVVRATADAFNAAMAEHKEQAQ